jgi:hypothetical protein
MLQMKVAPSLFFALLASSAHAETQPWHARTSCIEAVEMVAANRFDEVEEVLRRFERSADPDDRACAVYARVFMAENLLSIHGDEQEWLANRDRHLKRMLVFAKTHARFGARFADFEMEARMRRTRLLFEQGNKTSAVKEIRRTNSLLKARLPEDHSDTVDFVQGVTYTIFGQTGFLARTLMSMAGIGGSPDAGHRSLRQLSSQPGAYRAEAMYLSHHFAYEDDGDQKDERPFGSPVETARRLVEEYPTNPQYRYEYAKILRKKDRPDEAYDALKPALEAIKADPSTWAAEMRAKLFYKATQCAIDVGSASQAAMHRDDLADQRRSNFEGKLQRLDSRIQAMPVSPTPAVRTVEVDG